MLKFLIPVDGSEPNQEAVRHLRTYLGWMKDDIEIHLLNVQPHIPYGKRVSAVIGHDQIAKFQEEDGMAALKPAIKLLEEAKIPYRYSVCIGEPAETITEYAKKNGCDEILMGTRGMGSLRGMVLGSVAVKVIELSPVPVLLMKKRG